MQEKPELSPVVRKKLEEIRDCWQDLESTTQAKARQLFEANKADLVVQSYESLDQRLNQLEDQLAYVDQGQDLTGVNNQLKKLQVSRIKNLLSCDLIFMSTHPMFQQISNICLTHSDFLEFHLFKDRYICLCSQYHSHTMMATSHKYIKDVSCLEMTACKCFLLSFQQI